MKIDYIKCGDYYIPDLTVDNVKGIESIGKYGKMRYKFLKQNRHKYDFILDLERIQKDIIEVDTQANLELEFIINQLVEKEYITEDLKMIDNLEWTKRMNSIKNRAEEIILKEIVYWEMG